MNTNGAAPVPPSPPSMVTKSTPRSEFAIAAMSSSQNVGSPTADLIPTGSPVSAASSSTQSSMLSMSWKAVWREGLTQSRPCGIPRISAISSVTFAPGSKPPRPGFAPWLSLISIARTGADSISAASRCRSNRPSLVATTEVGRTDLVDQVAAVAVVFRQSALAGVVQATARRGTTVDRGDRRARQRPETHRRDVDDRVRAKRLARFRAPPRIFADGIRSLFLGMRGRRRRDRGERSVLDDRVAVGELDVVVGAEPEGVRHPLRRGVHPTALVAGERTLLVVAGGDVLTQLRPDRFEQVSAVPDHREVAQDRVPPLKQIIGGHRRDGGGRDTDGVRPLHDITFATARWFGAGLRWTHRSAYPPERRRKRVASRWRADRATVVGFQAGNRQGLPGRRVTLPLRDASWRRAKLDRRR